MSAQFTQGPWEVNDTLVVKDCYSGVICDTGVSINYQPKRFIGHEESRANARLIAAAPGLFAALNTLRDAGKSVDNLQHAGIPIDSEMWSQLYNACNDATAALALVDSKN